MPLPYQIYHSKVTAFASPPLQVLHRDRVLFNVRNGWDVAKFLSEPQK